MTQRDHVRRHAIHADPLPLAQPHRRHGLSETSIPGRRRVGDDVRRRYPADEAPRRRNSQNGSDMLDGRRLRGVPVAVDDAVDQRLPHGSGRDGIDLMHGKAVGHMHHGVRHVHRLLHRGELLQQRAAPHLLDG